MGELRPSVTEVRPPVTRPPSSQTEYVPPLDRLRGHDRPVIMPETCLVRECPVCAWRRAGLLDTPVTTAPVVRESDPSDYCPGCYALWCRCPDSAHLDAHVEASYALGLEHGAADGPEYLPTRRWVVEAGLDLSYLSGYDDACAGVSLPVPDGRLWYEIDDGLPF